MRGLKRVTNIALIEQAGMAGQSCIWKLKLFNMNNTSCGDLLKIPGLVNCVSITETLTKANKEQGAHSLKLLGYISMLAVQRSTKG